MKNSKLLDALQSFDYKDFKKFTKFCFSPYFNENETIQSFVRLLDQYVRQKTLSELTREVIGSQIFKEKSNDLKVRHLMSDSLRILEQFVAIEDFQNAKHFKDIHQLSYYRETGLSKHFLARDRQIRKNIGNPERFGNEATYYAKFLLERELNQYLADQGERKGNTNVTKASEALDQFFILQKLRYGCFQANYGKVFSKSFELFLLEEILIYIQKLNLEKYPLIQGYYLALMLFKDADNAQNFHLLKEVLRKNSPHFSIRANLELYRFAQNYCIGQINRGKREFLLELFVIYQETLDNKVAMVKGELSHVAYMNIVAIGCRLKKFEWVEHFINHYSVFLLDKQRASSIAINTALLYWHRKRLSDAVKLLSRVEFDEPFYALNAKSLLLKIYYELNEKEVLLSFCESFKVYLRRNKLVSKSHIDNYNNLIVYTSRLIKLKPEQIERFLKLKSEITSTKQLNNRTWLLQQLKHMEENYMDMED